MDVMKLGDICVELSTEIIGITIYPIPEPNIGWMSLADVHSLYYFQPHEVKI